MPNKGKQKRQPKKTGLAPSIIVLVGIVIFVLIVFLAKNPTLDSAAPSNGSPESQFDQYLKEGKPTFAFFHSTTCQSCIVMMDIVNQVYPEFKDDIALVDVNVFDPQNENLLQRAGINSIPTLVFIDRKGQGTVSIGVMEADKLRQELEALKESL